MAKPELSPLGLENNENPQYSMHKYFVAHQKLLQIIQISFLRGNVSQHTNTCFKHFTSHDKFSQRPYINSQAKISRL